MTAWQYRVTGIAETLDSYHGGTTLEEVGRRVAARLQTIPTHRLTPDARRELKSITDELTEAYYETAEDFDYLLGDLYDWADHNRIWIEPLA